MSAMSFQVGGGKRSKETAIFESSDFSFPAGVGSNPPAPQNIDLTKPLDAFLCPATIHFYIQESDSAGGKRAEKEKDLFVIQNLPTVTNAEFTGSDPDKTALIEMPRLNAAINTKQFGDSTIYVGRISNSELRIACSHPLISSGTFLIKVIEYN